MSYSGLSSSTALVLRFFVGMGFGSGCLASADDANLIGATVGVSQEEDTPPGGKADGDGASFIVRVIRIRVGERQRILEDGGGLVEGHTMSSQI